MSYVRQEVYAGSTVEVKLYHTYKRSKKGERRAAKAEVTTEQMKEVNRRNAEAALRWKLNENFTGNDFLITLTYKRDIRPRDFDVLKKHTKEFFRKMRLFYRQKEKEMKYVYVYEVGSLGAMHTHIVLNEIEIKLIKAAWKYGYVHIDPLDDSGNYRKIASYFIKYSDKTFRTVGSAMGKRYSCSRNLREPTIKRHVIYASTFKKIPREKAGFVLDKESVQSGFDCFGYEFFSYILFVLPEKKGSVRCDC